MTFFDVVRQLRCCGFEISDAPELGTESRSALENEFYQDVADSMRWDPNHGRGNTPEESCMGRPSILLPPDTERSQEVEDSEAAGTQFPISLCHCGSPHAKYDGSLWQGSRLHREVILPFLATRGLFPEVDRRKTAALPPLLTRQNSQFRIDRVIAETPDPLALVPGPETRRALCHGPHRPDPHR